MTIEYREKTSTCGCCGGEIPAGKIRWSKSGECPGHIRTDGKCGAIEDILQPSKKWEADHEAQS